MEQVHIPSQERRRHPRTRLQASLHCLRLESDGPSTVDQLDMFDMSKSGIGAMSDQSYYPGQRVVVRLPAPRANGDRHVYARVMRCRSAGLDGYEIGLRFEAASKGEEVDYRLVA